MFSKTEGRILLGAAVLFLSGLGWRVVEARVPVPALAVAGQAVEWSEEAQLPNAQAGASLPAPGLASKPERPSSHRASKPALQGPLNPNTATMVQLQGLPGIGPALAQRIVETRTARHFAGAQDLLQVKGIGPAKLEKIRTHLVFR